MKGILESESALPSQIVAVEGVFSDIRAPMAVKRFLEVRGVTENPNEGCMLILSTIVQPIPAPPATTKKTSLKEIQGQNGRPVKVMTACGPFTTTNNVQYLPLNDLLQIVVDQTPDVLVLVGLISIPLSTADPDSSHCR